MWESDLIRVIQECRAMNEGQRFGQLLYNSVAQPGEPQEDFHRKLFYLSDEELVKLLQEFLAKYK
jgi:hypothetical protein